MSLKFPSNDTELKQAVRGETDYADSPDELPDTSTGSGTSMSKVIERAKARVQLETGSSAWYSDNGIGHALVAYASMRAKAAVENAAIVGYSLGDQEVTLRNADPETSQQIQQWAEDVKVGLDASSSDTSQRPRMRNSTAYIGRDHIHGGK